MANIQRGDNRQYISKESEIDFSGQVASTFNQGINAGVSITQKANESTLASYQIDMSTKFLEKNNEINTKYQADPTNPQREIELRQAFDSLSNQYKINPLCQKQWADIKTQVYDRYKIHNAQWVEKQQQTNIQLNLKNGYENLTNQISMMALNGSTIDEVKLIYANGIDGLRRGAVSGLGEVVVNEFLKDSTHDIMATYISSLALNNPLEAQKLLKDESVRNDIGRAETLEKLDNYVINSLSNQAKKTAVNELCTTLRNMNSEDANNIINGKADLNKVMKFIETNKNLPEGSKDLILSVYGISSKSEYYYDKDKKIITNKKQSSGSDGSGGNYISTKKMTKLDKQAVSQTLEADLHNLISFSNESLGNLNVNEIKKGKHQKLASETLNGYMHKVVDMQGRIDSAYRAGAIDKPTRDKYINSFITPTVDYLESNLSQLDEGSWFRPKLGYERIAKEFNTKGLKGKELNDKQTQKLFAQGYYLDELNKIVQKVPNLKSIYDIESLSASQQKEIYKTASANALLRAKRWTDKPEIYFAKEYPTIYSQPYMYFNQNDSLAITRAVAEATYKMQFEDKDGNSLIKLKDFAQNQMIEEINKRALLNRLKAGDYLGLRNTEDLTPRSYPKNINEFYQRVKALGITPEQFMKDAKDKGFVNAYGPKSIAQSFINSHKKMTKDKGFVNAYSPVSIAQSFINSHKDITIQNDLMMPYYEALLELEQAKALADSKNKK